MLIALTLLAALTLDDAPPAGEAALPSAPAAAPEVLAPATPEALAPAAPEPAPPVVVEKAAEAKQCTLAVLDLDAGEGVAKPRAASFTDVVTSEVGALSECAVLSRADIRGVLSFEAEKQLLGCAADSCIAELAGALGADFLVTGSLAKIDGSTLVALRMTNLKTLKVVRRTTDSYAGEDAAAIPFVAWMARRLMTDDPAAVGPKPPMLMAKSVLVERRTTIWRTLAWTGVISAGVAGVLTGGLAATLFGMSEYAKETKQGEIVDFSTLQAMEGIGPFVADGTNLGLYITAGLAIGGGALFLLPGEDVVELDAAPSTAGAR